MTAARHRFVPRLMQADDAAAYLGVSKTKFLQAGISSRLWGGNRLYDVADLDLWADGLPYDDRGAREEKECDAVFALPASR
jgi:hypothetical protein